MSHVRHLFAVGAVVLTIGPAGAQDELWWNCLRGSIERIDDRTSDARTIAAAATAQCRNLRLEILKKKSGTRDDTAAVIAASQLREHDIDHASSIVLEVRAQRRGR